MAEEALKKLESQLQCSVCLDKYKDPKLLECFHIFCKECLDKLFMEGERQHQKEGTGSLSCPTCRQAMAVPNGGVAALKPAFHINQLLEIQEDLQLKGEINKHDGNNWQLVNNRGGTDTSPRQSVASGITVSEEHSEDGELGTKCSTHLSKQVEFFCETCKQLICTRCVVAGAAHHSHKFEETDKVVDRYRKDIKSLVPHLTSKLTLLQRAVEKLDANSYEMTAHETSLIAMVNHSVTELQEALEARRVQLLKQISETKHEGLHVNALQRDELGRFESKLKSCSECMRECVKVGNQTAVLSLRNSFLTNTRELEEEFTSLMTQTSYAKSAHLNFTTSSDLLSSCRKFGKFSSELYSVVGKKFSTTIEVLVMSEEDQQSNTVLQRFRCELVSDVTKERAPCEVEALGSNQYRISCTPTLKGRHLIYAQFDGRNVSGSPFVILVQPLQGSAMGPTLRLIDGIKGPNAVAFTKAGQLLVVENDCHCVSHIALDGTRIFRFGSKGSGDGQLLYPRGITISGTGEVVVADTSNHRLSIFQNNGHFIKAINLLSKKSSRKLMPMGVAWNAKTDQFYAACSHQILILDTSFSIVGSFGRSGGKAGALNDPYGVTCDGKGRVYVADTMNNRIQIFSPGGQFLKEITDLVNGSGLEYPISIATSGSHLLVSEYMRHRVVMFTTRGELVATFGRRGKSVNELSSPRGIAIDPTGLICVCDYDNNRLCLL